MQWPGPHALQGAVTHLWKEDWWFCSLLATILIAFCLVFFFLLPDGLAKKFGLTPEQFGENLRDSYQRHETEQFPAEPLELAKDYVCRSV